MIRAALLVALVAVAVGCGRARKPPPVARAMDAGAVAVGPAPAARGFVRGTVVVAARHGDLVRPLRLDPATGAWAALGAGDAHLFPTDVVDGDAVLVISARGEHEAEHVEQLAWVRGAAVAPFGPRAASIRNPAGTRAALVFESSERSFRDLYRVDAGGALTRLTDDAAGNFEPALSPDGATVVFSSSRDGDAELYRLPIAGGRATRLTASARDDWGARWSPDGRRLVFLSDREGPPRAFVMAADGTDLRRLTTETDPAIVEDAPRWSPDGATIALLRGTTGGGAIALVAADPPAGAAVGAPPASAALTPAGASDTDLAWSPDGAYLLVARRQPRAAPHLAFVRIADGVEVASDPIEPLGLRWFATSLATASPGTPPAPGG